MSKGLKTNVLGFPRIGADRELKKAEEAFWAGKATREELEQTARSIRKNNWLRQKEAGIDLIPSNDFSYYDQVLDQALAVGAIPERYDALKDDKLELYFAMAHGEQKEGKDVIAMEMTKWFDTNYHYIVPEFVKDQQFTLTDTKAANEYKEAKALCIETKPVIIGPVTFLLLGKEKEEGFSRIDLIDRLLPVYIEQLKTIEDAGAEWIQIDEPFLALDIDDKIKNVYNKVYNEIRKQTKLKIILTTYFSGLDENTELAVNLPVDAIHIDVVRSPKQLNKVLESLPEDKSLSLGVIDGRNIWKNDYKQSLDIINKAVEKLGADRVWVAGSSSFLHVPYDLSQEKNEQKLPTEIKRWLAFAYQKIEELSTISELVSSDASAQAQASFAKNQEDIEAKRTSALIHNNNVKKRAAAVTDNDINRHSPYTERAKKQHALLNLPLFPTTTIGSFPQTKEVRSWRAKARKGEITAEEYEQLLKEETARAIRWQEEIDIDVLVHGEFERNDMVEYFGEQLSGFTFTQKGWVQSYGSRCVKPPIIFGDVSRPTPMTVEWSTYAQSLTKRPVKGMLTGPVTILEWSFVRNDQPRSETTKQIALAIRDEVVDLESAGIKVIQIDEPAIREGLPLRHADWDEYLKWAVDSFRLSASGVKDETQIHTHMCYSEFNDIIEHIARMDADVITIECSRSQMELLDVFQEFNYPNEIGPGVYDIHSARVPSVEEITLLLNKAKALIPAERLWVNPDCGLKTRGWDETKAALINMIAAAKQLRNN
jgi:5-methyltetrahydropteroyltriglutamate--homocysteine methyltransferase